MSGIAEILHNQGYSVRGSDLSENSNVNRLRNLGILVVKGHNAENIRGAQVVVVSTAIPDANEEVIAARKAKIPVLTRGEMLAEITRLKKSIAISGTHGKTTTTSLIANILQHADYDPTVINGGIINTYNTNAKLGYGDWMVVEADESDSSFLKLPSVINIITNIDQEHMEHYKTVENLENAFFQFIKNLPFYGLGVVCTDSENVVKIFQKPADRRIVTYGFKNEPNFKGENLRTTENGITFDVIIKPEMASIFCKNENGSNQNKIVRDIFLPMFGEHNVLNAIAAIAVSHELGIDIELIKQALSSFKGVKRRFTILGVKNDITFVDDYAHHPKEIEAVLKAAKQKTTGRIVVVFQAHRYTRFSRFFEEFVDVFKKVDELVAAPVYSAGENPIDGYDNISFADEVKKRFNINTYSPQSYEEIFSCLEKITKPKDLIIGMGAGNITDYMSTIYQNF